MSEPNTAITEVLKKLTTLSELRAKVAQLESEIPKPLLKMLNQPAQTTVKLDEKGREKVKSLIIDGLKNSKGEGMRKIRAMVSEKFGQQIDVAEIREILTDKSFRKNGTGPATKFLLVK